MGGPEVTPLVIAALRAGVVPGGILGVGSSVPLIGKGELCEPAQAITLSRMLKFDGS
jgi:hypothetical protein